MECVMDSDLHIARVHHTNMRVWDRWIDRDQEKRNAKYESSWSKQYNNEISNQSPNQKHAISSNTAHSESTIVRIDRTCTRKERMDPKSGGREK